MSKGREVYVQHYQHFFFHFDIFFIFFSLSIVKRRTDLNLEYFFMSFGVVKSAVHVTDHSLINE